MPKYALQIQYVGTNFYGWQAQKNPCHRTVEAVLCEAISKVANEAITVVGAGRTDAGVHALAQVAHFETEKIRSEHSWLSGINCFLPEDCSVFAIEAVPNTFHARFSAIGRHYQYHIYQQPYRLAVYDRRAIWIHYPLDIVKMQDAATYLVGQHDFNAFRSSECQARSAIRTLKSLNIHKTNYGMVIHAHADGFLHHMVRNLVGVLLPIGSGKYSPQWAQEVLESKDRRCAGITAPASGLYLSQVDYPDYCRLNIKLQSILEF